MFDILKKVRDVATTQNCEAVMNACGRAVTAVLTPKPKKVEVINASKLKNFKKCDGSFTFTLYVDKPKDGTYYVVYLPRTLKIWHTQQREDAELLRDQMNNLKLLVNILEDENSKSNDFAAKLEQLRDSVIKNPSFNNIHHAAACNFSTVIIGLHDNHPSIVNETSIDGCYPLHIAVENNAKKAVQALLSLGAYTAKRDCHSRSAIHYGAKNPELLQLLAEAHDFADAIDVIDEDGLSPLCLAICSAKSKCVELLLDADCSTGPFPAGSLASMVAASGSSSDLSRIVDLLLIRAPQLLVEEINGSSTILHGKLESKLLHHILGDLADAININIRNSMNETPLCCAVARNDLSQCFALLSYNADVNIANDDGDTPLHISVKNRNIKLVKLLLCFGASVHLKNGSGQTVLDVGEDSPEVMKCLRLFVPSPLVVRSVSNDALFDLMQDRALEERYQMTSKQRQQLINVISFDGGGIRGLILLQILLHIEKLLGHSVMEHFQWLCGTSTGAIIALGLAKGYSLRHCQNLYLHMKDELFVRGRPYPEKIIEDFLCHIFGEKTTMAQLGPKKVIVTASYVQKSPPLLKLFRNYTLPVSEAENKALGYDNPCENLIWKCARYSSAAPTFFTPKDNFVDGGLMSNNPTLDLMADIHTYNAACIKAKKETVHIGCILSLGTGQAPPEDLESMRWNFGLPGGLSEGMSMFQNLINLKNLLVEQITASNGPCVTRARSWAHDQSIPFFRFSPSLSSSVELDEKNDTVIVEFLWQTEKYLRTNGKHNVETLVKYLKSL